MISRGLYSVSWDIANGDNRHSAIVSNSLTYSLVFETLLSDPSSQRMLGGGFTFEVQQLLTEDFCRSFKFEAFARRVVVDLQTFIEV